MSATQIQWWEPLWTKYLVRTPLTAEEAADVWSRAHRLRAQNEEMYALLRLNDALTAELARGKRCGVCGRYEDSRCTEGC